MRHLVAARCARCGRMIIFIYDKPPKAITENGLTWRELRDLLSKYILCSACAEKQRRKAKAKATRVRRPADRLP